MQIDFDGTAVMEIVRELVAVPSPAGFTDQVIGKLEAYLNSLGIPNQRNRKGGLLATLQGQNTPSGGSSCASGRFGRYGQGNQTRRQAETIFDRRQRWNHIEGSTARSCLKRVYTGPF